MGDHKEMVTAIAKAAPPVSANFWIWITSHDINWFVAIATLAFIGLQSYYLIRNKGLKP